MELRTLTFNKEEQNAFEKIVMTTTAQIVDKYFKSRVKAIQEYHAQLERRRDQIKKELETYADALTGEIRRANRNDETATRRRKT